MGSSLGTPLTPEEKASEQRYYGVPPSDERYMLLAAKDGDVPRLTKSLHFLHPCTVYDDYEDTPLHHAAVRGHVHACEAILRSAPESFAARNRGNNTPLHLAASAGRIEVVTLLLSVGADVDARGIEQFTPLHYACRDGAAPPSRRDVTEGAGRRAAAAARQAEVVRLLIEHRANADLRTSNGHLAYDLAWCEEIRAVLPSAHVAATKRAYDQRLCELLGCHTDHAAAVGMVDNLLPMLSARLICPITHSPMIDPVATADGHTYERYAITQWLETHDTSPLTGLELPTKVLTADLELRGAVSDALLRARDEHSSSIPSAPPIGPSDAASSDAALSC